MARVYFPSGSGSGIFLWCIWAASCGFAGAACGDDSSALGGAGAGSECAADADCNPGIRCVEGKCLGDVASCTTTDDCVTGVCTDGVCAETGDDDENTDGEDGEDEGGEDEGGEGGEGEGGEGGEGPEGNEGDEGPEGGEGAGAEGTAEGTGSPEGLEGGAEGGEGSGSEGAEGSATEGTEGSGSTTSPGSGIACNQAGATQPCSVQVPSGTGTDVCYRGVRTCTQYADVLNWSSCELPAVVQEVACSSCEAGATRDCAQSVQGICYAGFETCTDNGGVLAWSACLTDTSAPPTESSRCNLVCNSGETLPCYEGPAGTENVGNCRGGVRHCESGAWGVCVGQVVPQAAVCDGLDAECTGKPETNCGCTDGDTLPCYDGPENTRDKGTCKSGIRKCTGGKWGACEGQQLPTPEACDGLDHDCNGIADNGCPPPGEEGCKLGDTQECDSPCGKGQRVCIFKHWTRCDGPVPDANGRCPCEKCAPGEQRWCDDPIYCNWGSQSCTVEGTWSECKEVFTIPEACGGTNPGGSSGNGRTYDQNCCNSTGECCQDYTGKSGNMEHCQVQCTPAD